MGKKIKYINNENEIEYLNTKVQMTRGTLIEIHVADIHFGAINPKLQYEILCEQLLDKVKDVNFDIFSIDGDLFDHKFMSSNPAVTYACLFIDKVVNLCREKNATLFIIGGTESHDAHQLSLFYHYKEDPSIDIRIVEEAKFEYTKNAKILCIPELYGRGEEYYDNLLYHQTYDTVFMHGTYKGSVFQTNPQGLDSDREVTFKMENFCYCRGPIISGHVHTGGCFDKYVYYCSSPIRYCFGEEQPKGFLIVLHNLDTQEHYTHFEEIQSFRYDTINLDYMLNDDPKNVIAYVENLKKQGIDHVRLEFLDVNENNKANFNIIDNYYRNSLTVKIKYTNNEKEKILQSNEEVMNEYSEYEYILDPNLTPQEIFCKFVNAKQGYEYINVDKLMEILNDF